MQMVLRRRSGLLISSDEFMKRGPSHQYVRRSWVALEVPGRENTQFCYFEKRGQGLLDVPSGRKEIRFLQSIVE